MSPVLDTSRIYNDHDGWYIVMRESDEKFLTSSKYKVVGGQHLMGPFDTKYQLQDWFEGFLALHSEDRESDFFIADNFDLQT